LSKAESVILAGFFFALYFSLYGFSVAPTGTVDNALTNILAPPPRLPPPQACGSGDIVCATFSIAFNIFLVADYPIIFVAWAVNKVGTFFGFISIAVFGPEQAANAAPFIGLFWGALFIYVVFELVKIFRGNAIAGV
jgi:hypothetical protein